MSTAGPRHFVTPIELDRDTFMRQLISNLGHLNEGILGSEVAGAYVMNVGLSMGAAIEAEYKRFWNIERAFTVDEYAHVIVDLKQKIRGNFSLVSKSDEQVVVRTTSCPFDEFVRSSPSLCFMTSSVFGGIAARNFGWSKVALNRRIAVGDDGCHVTVYRRRTPEAEAAVGKEYTPDADRAHPEIHEQLRLMDRLRSVHGELGKARSQWEQVARNAGDAIVVVGQRGQIEFANAAFARFVGAEVSELTGRAVSIVAVDQQRGDVDAAVALALSGETFSGREFALDARQRTLREVQASGGPVRDDAGEIVGAVLIMRDVTDARQTQRLKDSFLRSAAHEIRTPLTVIRATTELLERNLHASTSADELARRLAVIRREADRLTRLASDLLDASRLDSGSLAARSELADLHDVVASVVEEQAELLSDHEKWTFEVEHDHPRTLVRASADHVAQIVTNLVHNAVKYTPEGGTIAVRTRVAGGFAELSVVDPGIGVPPDEAERLFTPFYRATNAPTSEYSGLGLGLYVSHGLAAAYGGELRFAPEPAGGSRFTLVLPLHAQPGVSDA